MVVKIQKISRWWTGSLITYDLVVTITTPAQLQLLSLETPFGSNCSLAQKRRCIALQG